MKWGRPVFMADEESGLGASFERLVLGADWLRAAELLECNDIVPVRALSEDDAAMLGKYLAPRSLRLELEGSDWFVVPSTHVTERKPVQQAGRLVASAYKAVVAFALVATAFACQACSDPLPEGRQLDAGPALDVIFRALGTPTMEHPTVIGVESNCTDVREGRVGYGFWLDGGCHGGLTQDLGHAVYVVLSPSRPRYSDNAAHEALHWVLEHGSEHGDQAHLNPGFKEGGAVDQARAALEARPDLNAIGDGR